MSATHETNRPRAGVVLQAVVAAMVSAGAVSTLDLSASAKPAGTMILATSGASATQHTRVAGSVSIATRPLDLRVLTTNDFGDVDEPL